MIVERLSATQTNPRNLICQRRPHFRIPPPHPRLTRLHRHPSAGQFMDNVISPGAVARRAQLFKRKRHATIPEFRGRTALTAPAQTCTHTTDPQEAVERTGRESDPTIAQGAATATVKCRDGFSQWRGSVGLRSGLCRMVKRTLPFASVRATRSRWSTREIPPGRWRRTRHRGDSRRGSRPFCQWRVRRSRILDCENAIHFAGQLDEIRDLSFDVDPSRVEFGVPKPLLCGLASER